MTYLAALIKTKLKVIMSVIAVLVNTADKNLRDKTELEGKGVTETKIHS